MIISFGKKNREAVFLKHCKIFLILSVLAVIISYLFIDIAIAYDFESLPLACKTQMTFITNLIDPKYHNYVWPILFFVIRFLFKQEIWGNRLLLILTSIPISNFLVWFIKCFTGRARPELLFTQNLYGFTFFKWAQPFESFPSGHACTIGALCGALACFYPRWSFPLMAVGFLLAFSRVVLTFHFLSDIIAGLALGLLVSQWIYSVMKQRGLQFKVI
jgi:membrane-associated phospholipid phosphatase